MICHSQPLCTERLSLRLPRFLERGNLRHKPRVKLKAKDGGRVAMVSVKCLYDDQNSSNRRIIHELLDLFFCRSRSKNYSSSDKGELFIHC